MKKLLIGGMIVGGLGTIALMLYQNRKQAQADATTSSAANTDTKVAVSPGTTDPVQLPIPSSTVTQSAPAYSSYIQLKQAQMGLNGYQLI